MATVKDLKRHIKDCGYKDDDVITWQIWTVEDVLEVARDKEYDSDHIDVITMYQTEVTKEMAEDVIRNVHENQSAEFGISWYTLMSELDDIIRIKGEG